MERSAARAKSRVVGDPFDENVEQGPQVPNQLQDEVKMKTLLSLRS